MPDADDIILQQLIEEGGIEVGDPSVPPDHPPAKTKGKTPEGWYPRLNEPGQRLLFEEGDATCIVAVGPKACRPLDTQIYTSDGLVRLGRLKPAGAKPDEMHPISQGVVSFDGRSVVPGTADGYWNEAATDAITAELSNGAELTGSPRHPVWTCWQSPGGAHGFDYYKLSEVEELRGQGWRFWTPFIGHPNWDKKEYVSVQVDARQETCTVCGKPAVSRGLCASHYQNLVQKKKQNRPLRIKRDIVIDEDVAYLLGALIGDGSINNIEDSDRSVHLTNIDGECVTAADRGVKKLGCEMWRTCFMSLGITPAGKIKPLLLALGMSHLSYDKRIPDAIIESPKSVAAAFLRGLFDTDGCVCQAGNVTITTVSLGLSRDVQSLLSAFGILSIRRGFTTAAGSPAWRISMHGKFAHKFGNEIGFEITRKQQRICKPRVSRKCPHGFNHNRYGYPDAVRGVMKAISLRANDGTRSRAWHRSVKSLKSFGSIPSARKLEKFCETYGCASELSRFSISANWLEVSSTKRTQCELGDLSVEDTHSFLAEGAINHNSSKSLGALHRIVRHCYEENNALVVIIGVSQRVASEGAGFDLVDLVLPTWRDGNREPPMIRKRGKLVPNPRAGELMDEGIGLEFTQWKLDPVTKDRHLWIANRHGGWSKVLLISIQYSTDVQRKLFGIQPSLVYIEELMNCDGPEYFSVPFAQLGRRRGIIGPQVWMATMNTEAPEHWTYKLLYEDCVVTSGGRVWKDDPEKPGIRRAKEWAVIYIWFEENEHNLLPGYRERLLTAYKADPILRQRMLEAKWLSYPKGEAIFKNHYSDSRHLHGDPETGTGLMPIPGYPIVVGYDPGQVHTGISFVQCIPIGKDQWMWPVLDELCYFGERIPYQRVARWLLEKMRYWCERCETTFDFRHVSGDDATTVFQPNRGSTVARDIEDYTRQIIADNGERFANLRPIKIVGCPKPPGSKAQRVSLVMDLLDSGQLSLSAACPWHRQMFMQLIEAKDSPGEPARGKYLHAFDSLSYPIYYQHYVLKGAFSGGSNAKAVTVSVG